MSAPEPQHDADAAIARFADAAHRLDPAAVIPMRIDPAMAQGNVQTGVAAVLPLQSALADALPKVAWSALTDLPLLAQTVVLQSAKVDRDVASPGDIARWRTRSAELRGVLLPAAEALAQKDLLPRDEVRDIRRGSGPIDHATDCVRLAGLFRQHQAAIASKHAVEGAEVDEAAAVGTQLLAVLRRDRAKPGERPVTEADRNADLRDRLWTLLVHGYADVRRVGWYHWLDAADDHTPPLGARKAPVQKDAEAEEGVTPAVETPPVKA